jgi:hypothetical protein
LQTTPHCTSLDGVLDKITVVAVLLGVALLVLLPLVGMG